MRADLFYLDGLHCDVNPRPLYPIPWDRSHVTHAIHNDEIFLVCHMIFHS